MDKKKSKKETVKNNPANNKDTALTADENAEYNKPRISIVISTDIDQSVSNNGSYERGFWPQPFKNELYCDYIMRFDAYNAMVDIADILADMNDDEIWLYLQPASEVVH